jgi:2-polyprenyl-3-methyl-5-hydroxy-6-metoxy-1,4-benzoquinol methylase
MSFERHEVVWTREKASRFWSFIAARVEVDQSYFSYAAGDEVIAEARRHGVPLRGRVLDFGCGQGYLMAHLLRRGIACEGADFDQVALAATERRVAARPGFRGTTLITSLPSALPASSYDVVFLLETIEHLIGSELLNTLAEMRRILRAGGWLVITTPNAENLEASKMLCPDCGAIFHAVQHVSSWTAARVREVTAEAGFTTIACEPVTFGRFPRMRRIRALVDHLRSRQPPNLLFIGQAR